MKKYLANRKILFIGIGFYDYESSIKTYLENCGAEVSYRLQQPRWHQVAVLRRLVGFFGVALEREVSTYQTKMLEEFRATRFDDVFVIKGDALGEEFMVGLRKQQPSARFIQYQWDSVKRVPNAMQMVKHFDRIYSFDRNDCTVHENFSFRPLFYRGEHIPPRSAAGIKYNLLFVGWLHADRMERILALQNALRTSRIKTFFFLFTGFRTYVQALRQGNAEHLSFRKMAYSRVESLMLESSCILDIPHPDQTGLTIRTIETLGKSCKLITTNADVVSYDFYDPSNVLFSPALDVDEIVRFLEIPFAPVASDVVERYSIGSWIHDIFA